MTHNPDNPQEHKPKGKGPRWTSEAARAIVTARHAAEAKARAVVTLEWVQGSRWHLVTACGRYTVAKALVKSAPSYGAWFRPTGQGSDIPYHLGEHATPEAAKATAQAHYTATGGKHPTRPGKVVFP